MDDPVRCPKWSRKLPCSGPVADVECPACAASGPGAAMLATYRRCEAHGGAAGAKRSLTAHKGICLNRTNPKETP